MLRRSHRTATPPHLPALHGPQPRRSSPPRRSSWAAIGAAVAVSMGAAGPALWHQVSAASDGGNVYTPLVPCRLLDTRPAFNTGVAPGRVNQDDTYVVEVGPLASDPCAQSIPADAEAVLLNVTAVDATAPTFLTFWADGTRPDSSSLNPTPGAPPTPNAVTVGVGADGAFRFFNRFGDVHVVIDVAGVYRDHSHDFISQDDADLRYEPIGNGYTKAEADLRYEPIGNGYTKAEADAAIDTAVGAAVPSIEGSWGTFCNVDSTGPGDLNEGTYETCATATAGAPGSHHVMLNANVEWFSNGVGSTGLCRLERDGVAVPGATMSMGENEDQTGPSTHHHTGTSIVAGPYTGTATYEVACREFINDPDFRNIALTVLVVPTPS